jgi:hypothetical protein
MVNPPVHAGGTDLITMIVQLGATSQNESLDKKKIGAPQFGLDHRALLQFLTW